MRGTLTMMRRELGAYFNSPIAYVVVAVFLLLTAVLFFNALFISKQAEVRELFDGFWTTLLIAIVGPAISMRLIAEEKSTETIETLMTMPIGDGAVVLGKYLSALVLFLFAMAFMAVFAVCVTMVGSPDHGPAISGFLGLFLTCGMYISIGLMTSSFTKNQIVAFILAVMICLVFWLLGKMVPLFPSSLQSVMDTFGVDRHLGNMARGVIDSRDVLYFVSVIATCLLVTYGTLESRRWR